MTLAPTTQAKPSAEDTRGRLLAAATVVFAEHGFYSATVREICKFAKVNGALVNYHFGDKLELYVAVLRNAIADAEYTSVMQDLFAQPDEPEVLLRTFISLMLDKMITRQAKGDTHMRLMLHELAQPTPAFSRVVDETVKPLNNGMRALVGRILKLPPEHDKTRLCAQSIIGQVIHYAHHSPVIARLWPELKMTAEQQEMVAKHIADFSLSYLRTARSGSDREAGPTKPAGKHRAPTPA